MNSRRQERIARWALGALVGVAVLAAFAPCLDNGLVLTWDDGIYIRDNPLIQGLGLAQLRAMLTSGRGGLWQPLTWLSLAIDHALWGDEPAGYHLSNILLHAASALLFYGVCLRLLKDATAAALAALFFAVHPLRVESVAWATERKDVLSGAFWMASLLFYLRDRRLASLACFALSLSAKIAGVSLPFLLALIDVYPLRRRPRWRYAAPFFAVAAVAFVLNFETAAGSGLVHGLQSQSLAWSAGQPLYAFWFYLIKTAWPAALSPYYPPRAWFGTWAWPLLLRAGLLAATAAVLWRQRRRRPAVAAALVAYAVMLAPVAGLIRHGVPLGACDRYTYLSCASFALLFGAAAAGRRAAPLLAAWLAALGAASWRHCAVWRDDRSLWTAAAAGEPAGFSLTHYGAMLVQAGQRAEGIAALRASIALPDAIWLNYENLGVALYQGGDKTGAIAAWRKALALGPSTSVHADLGAALASSGSPAALREGLAHLRAAATADPEDARIRADLADALARAGRLAEAEAQYRESFRADPSFGRARVNLGLLLTRQGRVEEAGAQYRLALKAADAHAEANYDWGNLLLGQGKLDEAERHFREALRIDPGLARAQVNLGNILARRGSLAEAAARYRTALKIDPGLKEAGANLAAVAKLLRR